MRSAISTCARVSKTDGPQSPDLQRGALETAGVDAVNVSTTSRPMSRRSRTSPADAALRRVFDCPKFVTATELVTMLVEARQLACIDVVHAPLCLKAVTCGARDCP